MSWIWVGTLCVSVTALVASVFCVARLIQFTARPWEPAQRSIESKVKSNRKSEDFKHNQIQLKELLVKALSDQEDEALAGRLIDAMLEERLSASILLEAAHSETGGGAQLLWHVLSKPIFALRTGEIVRIVSFLQRQKYEGTTQLFHVEGLSHTPRSQKTLSSSRSPRGAPRQSASRH